MNICAPSGRIRPQPQTAANTDKSVKIQPIPAALNGGKANGHAIDRTAKLFIGGKQARSDGNYTRPVIAPDGHVIGQVADGNRKDIRDAVEAAVKAADGWGYKTGHSRAQILYYIAENLSARADEFAQRLSAMTGAKAPPRKPKSARRSAACSPTPPTATSSAAKFRKRPCAA